MYGGMTHEAVNPRWKKKKKKTSCLLVTSKIDFVVKKIKKQIIKKIEKESSLVLVKVPDVFHIERRNRFKGPV